MSILTAANNVNIQQFMEASYHQKDAAESLKKDLKERCILSDSTTMHDLTTPAFVPFIEALNLSMSECLSKDETTSRFGRYGVHDYHLYHHFGNQRKRDEYLSLNPTFGPSINAEQLKELAKRAIQVKRFIGNQRVALIKLWDLDEGVVVEKKKRELTSTESNAKMIDEKMTKVSHEQALKQFKELTEDLKRGDDDRSEASFDGNFDQVHPARGAAYFDEEAAQDGATVSTTASLRKRFDNTNLINKEDMDEDNGDLFAEMTVFELIDRLPSIKEGGVFIRFNEETSELFCSLGGELPELTNDVVIKL